MTERATDEEPFRTRQEGSGPSRGDIEKTSDDTRIPTTETSEGKIDAEMTEKQPAQEAALPIQSHPPSSIRSRLSRRSTGEEGSEHTNSAEKAVREQVEEEGLIRRTPLYRYPIPGKAERWHEEVDTPSQWTSLFYGTYNRLVVADG
jgi:cell envelope opacity-associated protein A